MVLDSMQKRRALRTAELVLQSHGQRAKGAGKKQFTVSEIAEIVNRELDLKGDQRLTRERVYDEVALALSFGYLRFVPPVETELGDQLAGRFDLDPQHVHVVNTPTKLHGRLVADHAADLALNLIKHMPDRYQPVGIGLGPGRAALNFAERLAELLKTDPGLHPKLGLHAISAGGPAHQPQFAPNAFFTLFPESSVDPGQVIGLFAASLIKAKTFEDVKKLPGVCEAFQAREKGRIQIVATSMGDFQDPDDLARKYLAEMDVAPQQLQDRGWIGNVQYRPYGADGPILEKEDEFRAVTLFELEDLVEFARRKDHHVILMARQCGVCGQNRARALRPLLENANLRVFSELVLDIESAKALLSNQSR